MAILFTDRMAAKAIIEALGMTRESTSDMAINVEKSRIDFEADHGSQPYTVCKFAYTPAEGGKNAKVIVSELMNVKDETRDMLAVNMQTVLGMDFDVAVE